MLSDQHIALNAPSRGSPEAGWLALWSILALACAIAGRVLGPSDVWDHTQPKTLSYTTDILANGGRHWILPIEGGVYPATKPPLYNWLAAPAVRLLGFTSEIGHKFPSILALCACWLIVVRLGRAIGGSSGQALGWMSGLALVSNHMIFKLGYLARPDMLLTLWLLLAWLCATKVYLDADEAGMRRGRNTILAAGFWTCFALASLTKGPAALVAITYALLAAPALAGSWRAIGLLKPAVGLPLGVAPMALWLAAVWSIDPDHLRQQLWFEEVYARITGAQHDQAEGMIDWFVELPNMAAQYVSKFLPWSLFSVAAVLVLLKRRSPLAQRSDVLGWRDMEGWMRGAAIMVGVVIVTFTLSLGKRADYVAAALPPGALLASWWLLRCKPLVAIRAPWLAPALAAGVLCALIVLEQREHLAPYRGFGDDQRRFVNDAYEAMAREPHDVAFLWTARTPVQAMLGFSRMRGRGAVETLLEVREPFWVVAGQRPSDELTFHQWLSRRNPSFKAELVAEVELGPGAPQKAFRLFRVAPAREASERRSLSAGSQFKPASRGFR